METLEQLQRRIRAVDDLTAIVRTMKTLAAVNIRQYEQSMRSILDYHRTVELGLHVVLRDVPPPRRLREAHGAPGVVVFGSDQGMCGRFNEEVTAHTLEHLSGIAGSRRAPRVIAVGARVAELLERDGLSPEEDMFVPGSAARIAATVRQILLKVDEWQASGDLERCELVYNRPVAEGRHRPSALRLLPVDLHRLHGLEGRRWPSRSLPMYTMDRATLFARLLRQFLFVSVFRACAASLAAESASRLAAMQVAERSLEQRHEELLGQFRRVRQGAITAEVLDVVSGYEALRSASAAR